MNIPISSTVLFILASALLLLSGYILFNYQRSASTRFYAGFLVGLMMIAVAQALLPLEDLDHNLLVITRFGYLGGVVTFSMLLMFSIYFPVPNKKTVQQPNLFWIVPLTFFTPLVLLSNSFISSVNNNSQGVQENHGALYFLFPLLVVVYVAWSILNLFAKRGFTQGSLHPVGMFLWALVIATLLGLFFDVLLPAVGQARTGIGIYSAIALFGLSTYVVLKK